MRGYTTGIGLVLVWAIGGCAGDDDGTGDADGSGTGDATTASTSAATGGTDSATSTTASTTTATGGTTTAATTGSQTTGANDGCPAGNEWFEPGCQPPPAGPPYARFSAGCYVACEDASGCGPNESCQPVWYENACPCPPWEQFCCEACGGAEAMICLPV